MTSQTISTCDTVAGMETTYTHITSKVELADCPDDGGKWAIYCTHFADGEIVGTGVVQDTNKKRLASWQKHSIDWCCHCQNVRDYGTPEEQF
jgi:hypothetical protein